jgi:hypothetical protein
MRANLPSLSVIVSLLGATVVALPLRAASNLIENSPFLPASGVAGAAQQSAPLELRSILKEGDGYEFSLFDAAKKQSTWVGLNETGHDFTVKAFDPVKEMVTVEQKGRTYQLALKESKIALMAVVPGQASTNGAMPPDNGPPGGAMRPGGPLPGGAFPPGVRGPVGSTPPLTPEQLRNLEADINRRRELRRQAATAQSGGTAPAQSGGQQR